VRRVRDTGNWSAAIGAGKGWGLREGQPPAGFRIVPGLRDESTVVSGRDPSSLFPSAANG